MFRSVNFVELCLMPLLDSAQTVQYPNIGCTATPQYTMVWDIDVRPDFKGPPKRRGSVQKGEKLWDYINRAMPCDAPKILRADEVYAAVASPDI